MKAFFYLSLFIINAVTLFADEFTSETKFKSTEAFVSAAKAFKPADSKSDLAKNFTMLEEKGVTQPATADSINSCEIIFEDTNNAIAYVTAQPPTMYTTWKIGVIFYLVNEGGQWHISDIHRFDAVNKAGDITCELTSGEKAQTVITVCVTNGRRDWTYSESASYSPHGKKLIQLDIEQK